MSRPHFPSKPYMKAIYSKELVVASREMTK